MRIELFTEDSGTTADQADVERVDEYFKGRFRNVANLSSDLEKFGNVTKHVLSDEYGYIKGSTQVSELERRDSQDSYERFGKAMLQAAESADVVILLLTGSVFEKVVSNQWDRLVKRTSENSIWCIGVSRSSISTVNLDKLRSESHEVIFYERVGVARINSESKNKLVTTLDDATPEEL